MSEKKIRRIKRDGRTWKQRLETVAESYLLIVACWKCGSPCNKGYICLFCGDTKGTGE